MKGVFARLSRAVGWLDRLGWTVILIAHATAAAAWWWLMPGGFPIDHPRFWMNRILPIILFLAVFVARSTRTKKPWLEDLRFSIKAALATFWIVMSIALLIHFHLSFRWKFIVPLLLGSTMALSLIRSRRNAERRMPAWNALLPLFGFFIGALIPTWHRPLPPGTNPGALVSDSTAMRGTRLRTVLRIDEHATVATDSAAAQFSAGPIVLEIRPLLEFTSVSPDGCWSLFGPRQGRQIIGSSIQSYTHQPGQSAMLRNFLGGGQSRVEVTPANSAGQNEIRVNSVLHSIVWSHLNTYTQMSIAGHKRLYLSFSPCPEARIEVMPSDYPFGRPARFAYLDDAEVFHVAEASSAEKGPFKDLGKGTLARSDALSITFYDEDRPIYRVTLNDWSRQCSTQLSPTAGWGVPENSIEFALEGNSADSPASIFITLAATSIGRGFDTVGHKPGTYRNNLTVDRLATSPTTGPH